ncbi:MAG: diacylglycerol kinase family protein [Gammaproteobacteria bacterium]
MAAIKIIINASVGADNKEHDCQRLAELFAASDSEISISLAHNGTQIADLARGALGEKFNIIVAGGGDGTVNAVASTLAGTSVPLGILPLGTFNYFARNLNIPLDLENAVRNIIAGHSSEVDVGDVNGRLFLNNSSLGLYPTIIREREKAYDRWGRSKIAAFLSGAYTMFRPNPFLSIHLNADRKEIACRTPLVFVNNNAYQMANYSLDGAKCLTENKLAFYVPQPESWPSLLWLAMRALCGRLREADDLRVLCAQEAWIETRHRHMRVALDGEVVRMDTPLHYRMRPGALRVIVPAGTVEKAE